MPTTEIKLHDRQKSINWIFNIRHGEKHFRMCHETIALQPISLSDHKINVLTL